MENYQAHGLLIDTDAVDLVMPFGEQLGLTGEEVDLLMTGVLNRTRSAPDWLVKASPHASALIGEAGENTPSELGLADVAPCWDRTSRVYRRCAARSKHRLIDGAAADQFRTFGTGIREIQNHVRAQRMLNAEIPLLQITVTHVEIDRVCRGRTGS